MGPFVLGRHWRMNLIGIHPSYVTKNEGRRQEHILILNEVYDTTLPLHLP